jgi:hypothetical protein
MLTAAELPMPETTGTFFEPSGMSIKYDSAVNLQISQFSVFH